jgi:glycosyltransferase involved in cell wall biosynthesis
MRVAVVHDWITGMRGGERVLEALLLLFPRAELFTLVHVPGSVPPSIEARPVHVPALGRTRLAARYYRHGLPFMPALVERFDLAGFDLVISSSHCVAKGVRPPPGVPHLCYCHTPMRYVWDQYDAYFGAGRASLPVRAAMLLAAPGLRRWDRGSAGRVTAFVANSRHVRDRIRRHYGREAEVVYPPVAVERFRPSDQRDDYYIHLGALVPYKRLDLVVDAFNRLRRRLLIVGEGRERARLEARAGKHIRFLGRLPDDEVAHLLGRARAMVHAGVEDFGIALVEAQAAGAPVVALAAGGALETVVASRNGGGGAPPTGVLFHRQTPEALAEAVREFEGRSFEPEALQANARRFSLESFLEGMRRAVARVLREGGP